MPVQDCINNLLWLDYSANKLSASEKTILQKHCELCAICYDIKRGIDAMAKPEKLASTISSINAKVEKYVNSRQKIRPLWYWSAAASLVFGIGLSSYFMLRPAEIALDTFDKISIPKNLAKEPSEIKEIYSDSLGESLAITQPNLSNRILKNAEDSKINALNTEDIPMRFDLSQPLQSLTYSDTASNKNLSKTDTVQHNFALALNDKKTLDDAMTKSDNKDISEYQMSTIESVQITSAESKGFKKLNTKRVQRKTEALPAPLNNSTGLNNSSLVKNDFHADSVHFENALSAYTRGDFERCLLIINDFSTNPKSIYYEDALLIKAKIFIHQGSKKEAIHLLNTIISLKGIRLNEAKNLQNSIK